MGTPRRPVRYCSTCGRERRPTEFACPPPCGGTLYGSTVPGSAEGGDMAGPLLGPLAGLAELPAGFVMLLHGIKGGGKTTIGLMSLSDPYVVSCEMAPRLLLAYAKRLGVRTSGVSVPEAAADPGAPFAVDLRIPRRVVSDVLLDSLTRTTDPAAALEALKDHCARTGARGIAIVQHTKDREMRGPASLGHDADVIIEVFPGRLVVEKNRFGSLGSKLFTLGAHGAERPTWDRYYSIEGNGPDYRITDWPQRTNAPLAAPYRLLGKIEGLTLPLPPVATACDHSEVYPGGWIEPADIEARIAFARRNGLDFWTPLRERIEHGNDDGS